MATSNSKPNMATFFTSFFFLLLMSMVPSSNSFDFHITKFEPNQGDIIFQGAASVSSSGVLELTDVSQPPRRSIGRALYATPLQLWDSTLDNEAADFSTFFPFVIKANNPNRTADGLTFFLAPANSQIPRRATAGYFALFNSSEYNAANQIVAVEFDTYYGSLYHPWDPDYQHVGIDVNSIQSIRTVKWDWRDGQVSYVIITYVAKTLRVFLDIDFVFHNILTANIDLKTILPEWISIGFSAGVGDPGAFESHDILSWVFNLVPSSSDNSHDSMMKDLVYAARAHRRAHFDA